MVAIKTALRGAEGKASLDGVAIDAALKATLERLMPIYQKRWWPEHDRANREWIVGMQPLIDRHGAALSEALARVYGVSWPREPIPVDLTVTAGPDGAYGTSDPAHITMSPSTFRGNVALEMLFHESTHSIVPLFQLTHWPSAEGTRSSSRATAATLLPSSSTKRTACCLNSSVNRRRTRRLRVSAIRDIVSTFRKMSTKPDQAQSSDLSISIIIGTTTCSSCGN